MSFTQPIGFEDTFGKKIADSTRNAADIASHYPYSPERWKFFSGDASNPANQVFLQYNNGDSRYAHQRFNGTGEFDVHQINPSGGEKLTFRTAERFRYIVGYEGQFSLSFGLEQSLQVGDTVRIGSFRGGEGYGIEFNGSLGDNQARVFTLRNGSEVVSQQVSLSSPVTTFNRYSIEFAWYNIGRVKFSQTYTSNGEQIRDTLAETSRDDARGPQTGNLPISFETEPDPGTSGFTANVGSCAFQIFGDVDSITRTKAFVETGLTYGGSGDWEPFLAVRVDPDRNIVVSEFLNLGVEEFTGDDDIFVSAQAFSSQKVADSGGNLLTDADFESPEITSGPNSAMQISDNVDQIADNTGTLQTSMANPGGYQLAFGSLYSQTSGQGGNATTSTSSGVRSNVKRQLRENDFVVFMGRTRGATSGDATLEFSTEQDW